MCQRNLCTGPRAPQPGMGKRVWPTHWRLVWLVALSLAGLGAGVPVAVANSDWPEWAGTEPVNVSHSEWDYAWQPAIAAGPSGRMVVAWSDHESAGAPRDIYVVLSDDSGRTWSTTPQVISPTVHYSALPDALVVGDRRFVAWVDQSAEGGRPVALYEAEVGTGAARSIPSPLPLASTRPRLAASAGKLHVVFNAGYPDSLYILHATRWLTESVWPVATVIYTSTAAAGSWFPMLDVDPDGETLHVVWQDVDLGERAIKYMRWGADGADVRTLSQESPTQDTAWVYPSIAVDSSGNLHAVWGEQVGMGSVDKLDQYVRYTRYDAGSDWTSPERVYSDPIKVNADDPRDIAPYLALMERDNQVEVCVAWHGFREGDSALAEEVLLSCSRDGGQSWPSSPQNVSRSPGGGEYPDVSIMPSITFDASGQLHSVWQERVNLVSQVPYYEIYYAYAVNRMFLPLVMRS